MFSYIKYKGLAMYFTVLFKMHARALERLTKYLKSLDALY